MNQQITTEVIEDGDPDFFNDEESESEEEIYGGYTLIDKPKKPKTNKQKTQYNYIPQNIPPQQPNQTNPYNNTVYQNQNPETLNYNNNTHQ